MIKLKDLLKESKYVFDRNFGESLPTLSGVIKKHQTNKLNEYKKIQGYYLMRQLKDVSKDAKRSGESSAVIKALRYLYDRINQSYRDDDLSVDDVLDFFEDPRARKYTRSKSVRTNVSYLIKGIFGMHSWDHNKY
jgi:hypothetical protein